MQRIGIHQRRARLAVRHHLARSAVASTPTEVGQGLVALHGTDPASVFLAVAARTADAVDPAAIEQSLYVERTLIRMLGMRRTMFVVPTALAPVVHAACTIDIAARQRRLYSGLLAAAGVGDGDWLREVEEATAKALAARGEATGAQLSADEPRLRTKVARAEGKSYGSEQNITTWVLFLLAADGRIVRGRPRGTWVSSQWTWCPVEAWLPGGLADMPVDQAQAELLRRWLAAYGPATLADVRWWTGWTATTVKRALTAIEPAEVDLDGEPGLALADDLAPVADPEPWVALLPALDPTPMGWSQRSWYLGPHTAALFDRSGNVGPTVWCDGRVVGGWAQRADGEIAFRLLEDVGSEAAHSVAATADRLRGWLGPVRLTPRFRTPLERELAA